MPDLRQSFGTALFLLLTCASAGPAWPQGEDDRSAPTTIQGTISRAADGGTMPGAWITVEGTSLVGYADAHGRYRIARVPRGRQVLLVRAVGYAPERLTIQVEGGGSTVDVVMEARPVTLGDVLVTAPSRAPERVVEAPAAAAPVDPGLVRGLSMTGQLPLALGTSPGLHLAQNDIHDFNVNARGFNRALNRRVLVLQDGRDLSIPFLGSQEWSALSLPLEDLSRIEVVRGPGSALYGANAFSGVISITTPTAREVVGSKASVAGGELGTLTTAARHAGTLAQGRLGYRVNAGYERTDNWGASRTGVGDLAREYADAVDTARYPVNAPLPGFELRPMNGQRSPGPGATAAGDPDPQTTVYGGARLDYYPRDGSVVTVEGGGARVKNQVFLTPAGRLQADGIFRPWARVAWAADRFYLTAWYSGRKTTEPNHNLASGAPIEDHSGVVQLEAQVNRWLGGRRVRLVGGASLRSSAFDSRLTLVAPGDDDRRDWFYSAYGQAEHFPEPRLRLVAAARFDDGDLFGAQVSPKAAVVFSPTPRHSLRATVNRAFQTPNTLEYFLRLPAGPPADFTAVEAALRASPLGPALAGVPEGTLYTTSAAVPILARGNRDLDVEHVTTLELGYKGQLGPDIYLTLDAYYSRLTDFVTDILPGVNPAYAAWTAPDQVPTDRRAEVAQATRDILNAAGQPAAAAGLTRIEGGASAVVLSIGNAGRVNEYGVEAGLGLRLTESLHLDGNYAYVESELDESSLAPGQVLESNTPAHRVNVALAFAPPSRLDVRAAARWVDGYAWASGVFTGRIPPTLTIDLTAAYQATAALRVQAAATNLFDQRRYHIYGGSVIGRRVLVGVTVLR